MPPIIEHLEADHAGTVAAGLQESSDRSRSTRRESTPMSNIHPPSLVAQEPSSFEVAVRERSWDWVLELRRRLKVDLLLVDGRSAVLVPTVHSDQGVRLTS